MLLGNARNSIKPLNTFTQNKAIRLLHIVKFNFHKFILHMLVLCVVFAVMHPKRQKIHSHTHYFRLLSSVYHEWASILSVVL